MKPLIFALLLIAGPVWADCDLKREDVPRVYATLKASYDFCGAWSEPSLSNIVNESQELDQQDCKLTPSDFSYSSAQLEDASKLLKTKLSKKLFGLVYQEDEAKKTAFCNTAVSKMHAIHQEYTQRHTPKPEEIQSQIADSINFFCNQLLQDMDGTYQQYTMVFNGQYPEHEMDKQVYRAIDEDYLALRSRFNIPIDPIAYGYLAKVIKRMALDQGSHPESFQQYRGKIQDMCKSQIYNKSNSQQLWDKYDFEP